MARSSSLMAASVVHRREQGTGQALLVYWTLVQLTSAVRNS
jgi:hypothetical protein